MVNVPRFPPKTDNTKNTANVCIVKGMIVGILIQEHMDIITAPKAIYAKSMVLNVLFILLVLFIYQISVFLQSSIHSHSSQISLNLFVLKIDFRAMYANSIHETVSP